MSVLASMAAPTRSLTAFGTLLREARRHGRPGPIDYLTFLQIWLIPPQLRRTLRDRVLRRRRGAVESAVWRGGEASAVPATGAATADHDARR
jgi:hypothetical protein